MEEIKTTESNQTVENYKKPRKKLKAFFIITGVILIFLMFFIIISKPKKTAKDELSPPELLIYNSLLEGLDFFYNPQSVKILECSAIYLADTQNPYFIDSETGHCYIKVTAMTKGGGSSNKVYCLVTGDNNTKFPRGSMWTWDDVIDGLESMGLGNEMIRSLGFDKNLDYYIDSSDGINVGGLNKALKEHWEELGLD